MIEIKRFTIDVAIDNDKSTDDELSLNERLEIAIEKSRDEIKSAMIVDSKVLYSKGKFMNSTDNQKHYPGINDFDGVTPYKSPFIVEPKPLISDQIMWQNESQRLKAGASCNDIFDLDILPPTELNDKSVKDDIKFIKELRKEYNG